jgi:hypothetical protein
MRRGRFRAKYAIASARAKAIAFGAVGVASAAVPPDSAQLRRRSRLGGILEHEREFQAIADANMGTRASGTPGYTASADYVAGQLEGAGYDVTRQEFDYELFVENSDPVLDPTAPDLPAYIPDEDFATRDYSGSDNVGAELQFVGGIVIPSSGGSTSGCSPKDFADFQEGNIALIQRGSCDFRVKVQYAEAPRAP